MTALKKSILWGVLACAVFFIGRYLYAQAVKAEARIIQLEEQTVQQATVFAKLQKDQAAQQETLEKWTSAKNALETLRKQRGRQLKEAAKYENFTQWGTGTLPDGAVRVFQPAGGAD